MAGAHDGAVRADEFLLGAAEPVQLRLMLHAELTLPREDPGLGVGGGRSRRCGRHRGVPRLLLALHTAAQHGENGQLTIHTTGFQSLLRVSRGGRACQVARYELLSHGTITQQVHRENRSRTSGTAL